MQYIAAIDYEHLDNGVFLTSLARAISRQDDVRPILIHGDSEYTERVIQTGVMRQEARIRSIKDLNHRLIALLADQGVSAIGINGYQRKLICSRDGELQLDNDFIQNLPGPSALLISTLVHDLETGEPKPIPLTAMIKFLRKNLQTDELFIFSSSDEEEIFSREQRPDTMKWEELDSEYLQAFIPEEFHDFGQPVRLTTAREFDRIPDLSHSSLIQ